MPGVAVPLNFFLGFLSFGGCSGNSTAEEGPLESGEADTDLYSSDAELLPEVQEAIWQVAHLPETERASSSSSSSSSQGPAGI